MNEMRYLLGIDFGGGASKATLLCENGKICAVSTTEYPTYYPQNGYVEQDPQDWVDATCKNIRSVLQQSGVSPADIACIALDAATHTAVIMDEDFHVIRPAIYWTDTRSIREVDFLRENYNEIIQKQVLHAPGTIWTLPELMWIKNNEPDNWRRVKKILFAKDYVRHILTGEGCGCAIDRADPFIDRLVTFVEDRNKSRGSWRHVREICVLFIELQAAHSPGYRCGIGTGYTDHRNSALSASCRDRRYGAA